MTEQTTRQPYPLIKRSLKRGLLRDEAREFIAKLVNLCSSPTWSELYAAVLEPLTGLARGALARELRVTYATLRGWKSGRIPQEARFEVHIKVLSELTGVAPAIMRAARSRSVAQRSEGSSYPRAPWVSLFDAAGLPLCHYLRRLEAESDLTAEQIAAELSITKDDWAALTDGKRVPRKWQVPRILRVLGRRCGLLLTDLQSARDRGATISYGQRRSSAHAWIDRTTLHAINNYDFLTHGFLAMVESRRPGEPMPESKKTPAGILRVAAQEVRTLDATRSDPNFDYEASQMKPDYLRGLLGDLRRGHITGYPFTDDRSLRLYLESQLRMRRTTPLANRQPQPETDAAPEPELTAADIAQGDRRHEAWLDSQRRQYQRRRREEEEL